MIRFFRYLFAIKNSLDTLAKLDANALNRIITNQTSEMTTLAQLDQKITNLAAATLQVKTDSEALLAKANAGQDFTAEAAALQSSTDALGALHTEITAPAASTATSSGS